MPLSMDTRNIEGDVTAAEVAKAHTGQTSPPGALRRRLASLLGQQAKGNIVPGRCARCGGREPLHREAHGLVAETIHPVVESGPEELRGSSHHHLT